jgi:hypothetical protein
MRVRFRGLPPGPSLSNEAAYIAPQQLFLSTATEYEVYAVSVYDGITFVQLVDDKETPTFFPRVLFDVVDTAVPADWICNVFPVGPVQFVLGPGFVAKDLAAYSGMTDQRLEQLTQFWKRVEAMRAGNNEND